MGENKAKVLLFTQLGAATEGARISATPCDLPGFSGRAALYERTRDILSGKLNSKERKKGDSLLKTLCLISDRAEDLKGKVISRHLDGRLTVEQADIEMTRLQLITHLCALVKKIMLHTLREKPYVFRMAMIPGRELIHQVKKGNFMPKTEDYFFSSDEAVTRDEIKGRHSYFFASLTPWAEEAGLRVNDFEQVQESAQAVMKYYLDLSEKRRAE
jgi:hypothetical protein